MKRLGGAWRAEGCASWLLGCLLASWMAVLSGFGGGACGSELGGALVDMVLRGVWVGWLGGRMGGKVGLWVRWLAAAHIWMLSFVLSSLLVLSMLLQIMLMYLMLYQLLLMLLMLLRVRACLGMCVRERKH